MKIKLLYIGNKLASHGNTETSIELLGRFLEMEGYEMYYASSYKNKIIRMLDMIFKTIQYSRKVEYVLIDVYSTQNFWFAFISSQLCRILKLKYISILHGGNLPERINNNFFISKLIFNNSYKNSAPSKYLYEIFNKANFKNVIYIPNTINIENYSFKERENLVPRLLWVRSFSTIYNPIMAIKTLSRLKKDFPNAKLCMVGPDKENLLNKIKLVAKELNVEVEFTGKLTKKEWIKLSEDYNVFINTTNFDNTPVTVIEAMALGLPVVSTNVGGIPFLLVNNKNGLLVNVNDSEAMASAIKTLFSNRNLYETIVSNARNKSETFDWNVIKKNWSEILN
jgi:glycosyltransferase involved in cell wall biosynthesis